MKLKTLTDFQDRAIVSGVNLFSAAKELLDAADGDAIGQAAAVNHNGYLLIEAPTGTGKTLMAGSIVEKFSGVENVVWFWFAPFKGVTGQTAGFLREQFNGLRLRELADDRAADASRAGDVFVTTWQSVATRVKDKRNVRKDGELNPSVDTLTLSLRAQGLRVGVVVDEMHHGFGKDTQAMKFFREVLRPEYSILITATPDDREVREFEKAMGIAELHRISVSRADAVSAGLIKSGVKCMAYFVGERDRALVDLPGTALRDATTAHRQLKQQLAGLGVPLTPLMLVQVGNGEREVERTRTRLLELGFTDEQIATHTADEPDAGLLALANDDRREALIFKMAVALGFDAPRAFTLVSTRAVRDADFGVQLVGRILRTHRLLQGAARNKTLPAELAHGYVFLADSEAQDGLNKAGQLINKIQTAYATASPTVAVMNFGGRRAISGVDADGQTTWMLETQTSTADAEQHQTGETVTISGSAREQEFNLGAFFGTPAAAADGQRKPTAPTISGTYVYKLRADIPRKFKTQEAGDNAATEEECAQLFTVSTRALFEVLKNNVPVEKRTLEVFTQHMQQEFNYTAALSPERAALRAQQILFKNQFFDPRELRQALLRKMAGIMREEALPEAADSEQVARYLDVIISAHPELLDAAQKQAVARHMTVSETEALPEEFCADAPLTLSPRNIYGVIPPDLNSWERAFVEQLDREPNNLIAWWHRNEPRQPWAVNALRTDGRGFYPDFIISVNGRKTENGILLVDTKRDFAGKNEAPKVLAEHRVYGRAMLLYLNHDNRWLTVTWDKKRNIPVAEQEFRWSDMAGFL